MTVPVRYACGDMQTAPSRYACGDGQTAPSRYICGGGGTVPVRNPQTFLWSDPDPIFGYGVNSSPFFSA